MSDSLFDLGGLDGSDLTDLEFAKYCMLEEANCTLNSANIGDLSILYINIVSLPCNMDKLINFLSKFDKKPDLIALSETKITEKRNTNYHPHIENYTFFGIKSKSCFGSVGIFARNEFTCKKRNDLNCSEEGLYETLWLDISSSDINSPKTTIGVVYRHTGEATIPHFTTRMENIINKLIREKANYYIFGDYNINLIKTDDVYNISEFVNTMHSLNSINFINSPTWFPRGNQPGNPSILDHFWTNQPARIKKVDLIIDPISDHRPTLCVFKMNKKITPLPSKNIYVRDMKNFDHDAFNVSLSNFEPSSSNIDQCFSQLQAHISNCIEKHAPLRKRTRKEMRFVNKPWISESIQISINNKNNLYAFLQKHDNPILKRKYNKKKKLLKKVIFAARCRFFERRFAQYQNNSKKIWGIINDITCRKNRDRKTILSLKLENGSTTDDPKTIANILNEFFC